LCQPDVGSIVPKRDSFKTSADNRFVNSTLLIYGSVGTGVRLARICTLPLTSQSKTEGSTAVWFVLHLYQAGLVSAGEILEALLRQNERRIPVGTLAVQMKKMSVKQVAHVLAEQADRHESFGQLAVALGHLSEQDLAHLLMVQNDRLQPLSDILVELGAIDRQRVEMEYKNARRLACDNGEHLALTGAVRQ
jgi:hypothetical protein